MPLPTDPHLTDDSFQAWLIRDIFLATTPPDETHDDARLRHAAIIRMYDAYEPATDRERMIASQCVMLRFAMNAAVRDAEMPGLDVAWRQKSRAAARSVSRDALAWEKRLDAARAERLARDAEAAAEPDAEPAHAATRPPMRPAAHPDPDAAPPARPSAPPNVTWMDRPGPQDDAGRRAPRANGLDPAAASNAALAAADP